ncbi:MAG TPA: pilus assembly protein TadG-related protein, partial [Anaerolineales bacterium]|nr:pilus assembly protein TadG-related protein [Anaerolineales bacterium]
RQAEQGQILVIFSIAVIAFVAILALVLDGGLAYASRRAAQNAADAGALAGARVYCVTEDITEATYVAREYAITRNEAAEAYVTFDTENKVTTVTTTVPLETSFAHIWGFGAVDASAVAAAGCVYPGTGNGVLPIAWACLPPINESLSGSEDCQEQMITEDTLNEYLTDPPMPKCDPICPELYILMNDNSTLDDQCYDPDTNPIGPIDCDIDDDGDNDVLGNGGRSWLDLNGSGGGASELIDWIDGGFDSDIYTHMWVPEQSGVNTSVFMAVDDYLVGQIAAVPVFDSICDNPDTNAACAGLIHPEDVLLPGSGDFYHIIGFAAFYITCVDTGGGGTGCPGHDAAVANDTDFAHNTKTIEGYFITGFVSGLGGGSSSGIDTGAYALLLTK